MGGPESGERLTIPSADPAEFTKPATADSQAVPFENASTSSVRPAASDYDGAASAMGGSTMVVESTDELEARIAAIEAEKALALKAEAEREAEDERRRAEDKEQRAAAKAAEDRRAEESRRFAEEQAAAHAREERKKSEEEASKKKAGLDFRRHARRGFKRDNES